MNDFIVLREAGFHVINAIGIIVPLYRRTARHFLRESIEHHHTNCMHVPMFRVQLGIGTVCCRANRPLQPRGL